MVTSMVRRKKEENGFTLVELLVVVTIIGLLAGIAMVNVQNAKRKAAENILRYNLHTMRKAIDDFYADKQKYPQTLQDLVDAKYLRVLPKDPITESSDTWIPVNEEPSEADASGSEDPMAVGGGIVDVKSGAEGKTLDDVPYSEL